MNFTYENQGNNTFLVYAVDAADTIDSMSLGMVTYNKIPGIASTLFMQMDTSKYIKYNVTSKIPVKQFFAGVVNKKRLIGVFTGITDAMLAAEDYMIDMNMIIMDLDYIFADVTTCETVLICLPVVDDQRATVDLSSFFKNIMFTTQFDQTENCDHVAKIMNYLNSSPVFSLTSFKELLRSITNETANGTGAIKAQPVVPNKPAPAPAPEPVQTSVSNPKPVIVPKSVASPKMSSPSNSQSMNTPAVGMRIPQAVQAQPQAQTNGKQISFFYLMQHYNKENAELYKAQKAAKKSGQAQPSAASAPQVMKQQPQAGFAIPGQNTSLNQGFAIPGQQTPVQTTPVQQQPVQQRQVPTPTQQQQPSQINRQPVYTQPQMPQGQSMNFGETTVLGGGGIGETTVLGATPAVQVKPHLIRVKNNEKIDLNKPVFRIGKEKSYVDYFISDNSAISRSHANIISRDGEYFVVDTNSTNHTYVNGVMIQSNIETKIANGAKIKLANEDFEFRLY